MSIYLEKAQESLQAAELCHEQKLYNSTANRAYYAMFQAAIVTLEQRGFQPRGKNWSHESVPGTFAGELTRRRKIYSPHLARYLVDGLSIRNQADYRHIHVSKAQAQRIMRWAKEFVGESSRNYDRYS